MRPNLKAFCLQFLLNHSQALKQDLLEPVELLRFGLAHFTFTIL